MPGGFIMKLNWEVVPFHQREPTKGRPPAPALPHTCHGRMLWPSAFPVCQTPLPERAGSLKFLPSKCTRCQFFHQGCNHNNTTNPPKHPATIIPTCCSCSLLQITPQQQIPTSQLSRVAHLKMRKVTQLSLRVSPRSQHSKAASHVLMPPHDLTNLRMSWALVMDNNDTLSNFWAQERQRSTWLPWTERKKTKNKNKGKMMKEKNAPMLSNTFPQGDWFCHLLLLFRLLHCKNMNGQWPRTSWPPQRCSFTWLRGGSWR